MKYEEMTDSDKLNTLKRLYEQENKSFGDIAEMLGTYPNKIRRDAIKHKISIRDKSLAQKNALKTGKHKHPTKGTIRDDNTKQKIGHSVLKSWDNITDHELQNRKNKAKENWEKLSEEEKNEMLKKANIAVRKSSKEGSKLEKFILESLIKDGYRVIFHQEQTLANTKLQIDIAIPSINVAIEVDGPSHFSPVWGSDALSKNIKYDQKKEGLILGKGLFLIRIKQTKDYSKSRACLIYDKLRLILNSIQTDTIIDKKINIDDK